MEMKKIVAFGASNSKESINKKFEAYAASQIKEFSALKGKMK
jgi:NAD(P)H-dependent FMN reductase